jgi:hypothetical protein
MQRTMMWGVVAGACLLAGCDEGGTYVYTGVSGQVTGLWLGATLEVVQRESGLRSSVEGSDPRPGPPDTDAVEVPLLLYGTDGAPYELSLENVAPGFSCDFVRGRTGVLVDGASATPLVIACTSPVDQVTLSAAPDWRIDLGAVAQTAPVPTAAGATSVSVTGSALTRVMVDGVDTAVGLDSRQRFLGLGANAMTLELHAGYATRRFELVLERGGLIAPATARRAPVPDPYAGFGAAIAADGDRVAVAAHQQVYVFRVADGTWHLEASIGGGYPTALALVGDTLAIGLETTSGACVELHRADDTGWRLEQRLTEPSAATGTAFGRAVALFADTLVVGAPQAQTPTSSPPQGTTTAGAAYVYRRAVDGWALDARLVAPNAGYLDHFGASVAISFNVAAIGAPYEDGCDGGVHAAVAAGENCEDSGAVYTFVRLGSWDLQSYIKAPRAFNGASFGTDLAYAGELLVVGAPGEPATEPGGGRPGAAHVLRSRDPFAAIPWQAEAHLGSQIPDAQLGARVAVGGELVIASSQAEAGEISGAGAVQLFAAVDGGWQPRGLFKTARPTYDEGLGRDVAVAPHAVLVSAVGHDGPGDEDVDVGAVHELRLAVP